MGPEVSRHSIGELNGARLVFNRKRFYGILCECEASFKSTILAMVPASELAI